MEMRYDQLSPVPPLTKVTKALIITCVVTYFVDFILSNLGFQIQGLSLRYILGLVPAFIATKYWFWQFFTYIFMHGHPLHILLNMLILWYFGAEIEIRMGAGEFLRYFLLCGIGAGVFNFFVNCLFANPVQLTNPIIGASGAIFGILAAYGIFFANRYFLVFFLFPMKAKYFVMVMAAIELITGVEARPEDNVAHFAHVGGMFIGALYIYFRYIRPTKSGSGRRDYERERLKKQFTLIVNEGNSKEKGGDHGPYWN
jgi:membrane associated rhomboid family serine protease